MLKRPITYKDFNGNEVTETFYFHISERELIELEVDYAGGLEAALTRIIEEADPKKIVEEFKKIVLLAYGEKSEDGRRFVKTPEVVEAFSQTAAYNTLFYELATDAEKAAEFINGIVPPKMGENRDQDKPAVQTSTPTEASGT